MKNKISFTSNFQEGESGKIINMDIANTENLERGDACREGSQTNVKNWTSYHDYTIEEILGIKTDTLSVNPIKLNDAKDAKEVSSDECICLTTNCTDNVKRFKLRCPSKHPIHLKLICPEAPVKKQVKPTNKKTIPVKKQLNWKYIAMFLFMSHLIVITFALFIMYQRT